MTSMVAVLTFDGGVEIEVVDEHQLHILLAGLPALQDGQAAILKRGSSDFITATRHGEFWSVRAKRGRMWMIQSLTAAMTSEYSERCVREDRMYFSLRQRLMRWLRSRPAERSLSTTQVRTLFGDYLSGRKFSLPFSGA